MSDRNDNIIDFNRNAKKSSKGFPYVKLLKDSNGNYYSEEYLREYSKKVHYIVTIMRKSTPAPALYKYNIPQVSLIYFLNDLNNKIDDELIDIEKYIPEDLA